MTAAVPLWLDIVPQLLEGAMLMCFGVAWPLSTLRMLRSGRPEGKSLGFTMIIWSGYLCGLSAKLILAASTGHAPQPVVWLYLLNSVTVGAHAWLYRRCTRRVRQAEQALPGAAGVHAPELQSVKS